MDLKYFERLLSEAELLRCNENSVEAAIKLRDRMVAGFKNTNPVKLNLIAELEALKFHHTSVIDPDGTSRNVFTRLEISRDKLIVIIKDKIHELKYSDTETLPIPEEVPEKSEPAIKAISDPNMITRIEFEKSLKIARRLTMIKDFGAVATVFSVGLAFGYYFGTSRFDREKLNMAEEIRAKESIINANASLIDSLNKLRKSTIPNTPKN